MWKESYKIGVETIDEQHFQLFQMVEQLLVTLEKEQMPQNKQAYFEAISFMKEYVMKHFKEEEQYQESIFYKDIEKHKQEHRNFAKTILEYEKRLLQAEYDKKEVKNFVGTLTAWLIYHVKNVDQKMVNKKSNLLENEADFSFMNCFYYTIKDVFCKMANVNPNNMNKNDIWNPYISGDIFIEIPLSGNIENSIIFAFSKQLACKLIENMTFVQVEEMDEFVLSALSEVSNIVSGNVLTEFSKRKINCNMKPPIVISTDITPKNLNVAVGAIEIDTEMGILQIALKSEMFIL